MVMHWGSTCPHLIDKLTPRNVQWRVQAQDGSSKDSLQIPDRPSSSPSSGAF